MQCMHTPRRVFVESFFSNSFSLHCYITLYGKVSTTDSRLAPASILVPPPKMLHKVSFMQDNIIGV